MILAVLWRRTRAIPFGNPLGDLVVPLLLRPPIQKANDNHSHVVASNPSRLAVGGETIVHHVFADSIKVLSGSDASSDKLNHGLGRLAIPDTCST